MLRNILLLSFGVLTLMLGIGYFSADPGSRETPSAADAKLLFDRLAFSGFAEEGPTGTGPYLRRWTEEVRIAVIGAPEDEGEVPWSDGVRSLADTFDTLRGLDVSVVADVPFSADGLAPDSAAAAANLKIVTVPVAALEDFIAGANLPGQAAAALRSGREGCAVAGADAAVLANVTLVLRDNLSAGRRQDCLGEGLAMALGFNIESKHAGDVFRVRPDGLHFHGLGRVAAELVYDPALKPGMTRPKALEVVPDLLAQRGLE